MEELKVMATHFPWVGRRQLLDAPTRVQSDGIKVILSFCRQSHTVLEIDTETEMPIHRPL